MNRGIINIKVQIILAKKKEKDIYLCVCNANTHYRCVNSVYDVYLPLVTYAICLEKKAKKSFKKYVYRGIAETFVYNLM